MTSQLKVIKLFNRFIDSDVREELMEQLEKDFIYVPEIIDNISEDQAKVIIKYIESYANENLTIQGESAKSIMGFFKIIEKEKE